MPGSPDSEAAIDRLLQVGAKWQSDVAAVWLYGSQRVANAAKTLDDEVNELFMIARARQLTWDEYRVLRVSAEGALEDLIRAMRQEAALPSFDVILRWRPEQAIRSDGGSNGTNA